MRALLPFLVAAAVALAGCGSRERANPFDPLNPATSGRPSGFLALAGDREVTLRWNPVSGGGFTGYQIFRRGPGETGYTELTAVLSPALTTFRDIPLVNGADYAYRLYFVFLSGLGSHPAEDTATPGAAMPWVVEGAGSDLVRLTPDNRHVMLRRGGNEGSVDVAANPSNGDVWVADQGSGRVVVYQAGGGVTVSVPGFNQPAAVTVDAFDATAWICDLGRGRVYHLRRDGQLDAASLGPLDRPVDAAVDPFNGFVWVCEFAGDRVVYFDDTRQSLWSASVPGPSRVAVDSTTREGWVTSFDDGTVTRISPAGNVLGTFAGFVAPLGVAVDSRRGRIWIADPYAGRVTALDRAGQEEFHVTGLDDAGDLSVDLGTGEVWAALGATGTVARISPTGVVLREQRGFRTPISISVDPGGR